MKKYFALLLMLAVLVVACNTPTPVVISPEDDPLTTPIVEGVPENVKRMSSTKTSSNAVVVDAEMFAALVKIQRDTGDIIFNEAKLPPASLAAGGKLTVGKILVGRGTAKLRRGFLRKITNVTRANGQVIVKTEQGKLNEVFTDGGFRVNRRMKLADAEFIVLPTGEKRSLNKARSLGFPVSIDFCPINLDGNKNTTNDQVCVDGSVDLDLDFDFTFQCKGFLCSKPYLDTNVTVTQTANLDVTGQLTRSVNKTITIGTVYLPVIVIPVGFIPLTFVPKIDLKASLDGTISANFSWSADQEFEFTAGIELEDGKFDTYSKFSKDISTSGIKASIEMNAEARVDVEASVLVFGIGGPLVTAGAFVEFNAGFPRDPTWSLEGGFDVSLGLELDLFGLISANESWEIYEKRYDIAHAPNSKPTIVIESPLSNEDIELPLETLTSGALTGYIKAVLPVLNIATDDAEDGVNCCDVSWTVAGLQKTTAPGVHKLTNVDVFGESVGVKPSRINVVAVATDSSGATASKTWAFNVIDCRNSPGPQEPGFAVTACPAPVGKGTFSNSEFKF